MDFAQEIKNTFKNGNMLIKLIFVNVSVFLLYKIINVLFTLFQAQWIGFSEFLAIPAAPELLLYRPWTVITYMFYHEGLMHILFNMLVLFWFGRIFLQYFNEKQFLGLYILGGLGGSALFVLFYNIFPYFSDVVLNSILLGASASIMAIVIGIAVYVPNYSLNLLLLGPVKLKHIAMVYIGLDIINMVSDNAGGHISHLGGALVGYWFFKRYREGKDITKGVNKILDWFVTIFKPRPKMRVEYKRPKTDMDYNKQNASDKKEMDRILDKIAKSGYDSLSKQEKDLLFKMSNKK